MKNRGPVYACPYCGSRNLERNMLVGGPLATVDNNDNTYTCRECKQRAVPLEFHSVEEWIFFKQSLSRAAESEERAARSFIQIPIVPVDTRALVSVGGIDMPLGKVAEVVSVEWADGSVRRGDYAAKFDRYWNAISGTRYNSSDILMMDLAGIVEGKPNFRVLRELAKKKYGVWLDLGIRSDQDIFDAFSVEIYRALADTSLASSMHHFEDLYALSDRCVPCIQVKGEVIWQKRLPGLTNLRDVINRLVAIGFDEIAVMDLNRLGTRKGVSTELMGGLEGMGDKILIGGGVVEADMKIIEEAGFSGAFIDPFTPVIKDIIGGQEPEKAPTAFPAMQPIHRPKKNYLTTD
jgi:uncharacterized protein related to proFAR isomerase